MKAFGRLLLWSILGSLVFGLLLGTVIRKRLERLDGPVRYLGAAPSARPTHPLGLLDPGAVVLETREGEEEIG